MTSAEAAASSEWLVPELKDLERRAHQRAVSVGAKPLSQRKSYKYAGRKVGILRYQKSFEMGERDYTVKLRVPGKRKSFMRFELEF